jgi:hypothetical protein
VNKDQNFITGTAFLSWGSVSFLLAGAWITGILRKKYLADLEMQWALAAKHHGPPSLDRSTLEAELISHHLYVAVNGVSIDSGGVYFDSYIR